MRFLVKAKTIAISTILLAAMIFPTLATAQRSDLFFKVENEDIYDDRDIGFSLNVNGTGNDPFGVPLGSGLLVLTMAGAGYAIARRKRSRRNKSNASNVMMLFMALALMLGTTQCKKRIETITSDNGNMMHFSLYVGNNSRHIINPNENGYVPVRYVQGDIIYVGDGTKYIGSLTCTQDSDEHGNNAIFNGDIATPSGDMLYFYFVGTLTPQNWDSGETRFTVDISDQGSKLPVLSYVGVHFDGSSAASCSLHNQCALVEFKFAQAVPTSKKVKISNMYTEAVIDFAHPSITHTEKLDAINLYRANNTDKWAILMYDNDERSAMGMVYRENGGTDIEPFDIYDYYDGVIIPELSADTNYFYGSTAVSVNNNTSNLVNNEIFVVSANGNAVHISMGNLKCTRTGETWTPQGYEWSFIYPPYQLIETGTTSVGTDYSNRNVVDHFGWGCTGYQDKLHNSGQQYYLPYNTTISQNHYDLYGPTSTNTEHYNLIVSNFSDWGYVNITNGGNYKWRLLTETEWDYMMNHRFNAEGSKAPARVIGCNGWIVLPEKWEGHTLKPGTSQGSEYTYNKITTAQGYVDSIQSHGAIFLPACGSRNNEKVSSVNSSARYWLSTVYDQDKAYSGNVTKSSGTGTTAAQRSFGYCVRLVR